MASKYKQVSYGSKGDIVRQLQTMLNEQGYQLQTDGIFGEKTRSAVRDYQQKNGLKLDGIVGTETWGALRDAASAAKKTASTVSEEKNAYVSAGTAAALALLGSGYRASGEVKDALKKRQAIEAEKPADYVSGYDAQLKELYGQIANRESFSYDPESDPVYLSYAKQYMRQGQAAMEDTMGKASSLTGGYGSTYAQSSAQQAYESYLAKLQDVLPGLQESAYQQYKAQGDALLQRYDLLKEQDEAAYERWQDEVSAWQKAVSQAQDEYENAASADLKKYQMLLDYYADKAANEMKLTASGASLPQSAVSSIGNLVSLSSIAGDSLLRRMDSFLKSGEAEKAAALLAQYKSRMTPALKSNVSTLFKRFGLSV